MGIIDLPLGQIIPYARNPRRNEKAIATVAALIAEFGWRQPIVVDEGMVMLAGHTRPEAARKLGLETAPVHVAKGLTETQARAFRIMDNRSSENAEDDELLEPERCPRPADARTGETRHRARSPLTGSVASPAAFSFEGLLWRVLLDPV